MSTPPVSNRAQIDADIERLLKASVAAAAYATQLEHLGQALAQMRTTRGDVMLALGEAREALQAAVERALDIQHRLPGRKDVLGAMPSSLIHELADLGAKAYLHGGAPAALKDDLIAISSKVEARQRGAEHLRGAIGAELATLRARALGRPEPKRELTVADVADTAVEADREEHSIAAREALRKVH